MKNGIICIETEWLITKSSNRLSLNSEPLMKYISEMYGNHTSTEELLHLEN